MALAIVSPEFSFVRFHDQHIDIANYFEDPIDGSEIGACLPVLNPAEIVFQLSVTGTEDEVDYMCALDPGGQIGFAIIKGSPTITIPALPGGVLQSWSLNDLAFQKYRVSDTEVVFTVQTPVDMFDFIACEECFQMIVYFESPTAPGAPTEYLAGISNCFRRICDSAFTSLVQYSSDGDAASFRYCASSTIFNQVRVYMYPSKPSYTEESGVYVTSDGTRLITESTVGKQYPVKTEWLPEWLHDCIVAIFSHDTVKIYSNRYTGNIVKNGAYEVAWQDYREFPLAPASFKADISPFIITNSNCGGCESLAYGIVASNHTLPGVALSSHTYTFNLYNYISSPCCYPVTFSIVSTNSTAVFSASITGGTLTVTTNAGVPTGHGYNAVVFRAACGNAVSNDANIQLVF